MNELFEVRLSGRLHAHPLPDELPDLAYRSIKRGEQLRRRRIGAVVAVVALLLVIPSATAAWLRASNADHPPVTAPSTPAAPVAPVGPRALILDPIGRQWGPEPDVAIVRDDQTVWLPNGTTMALPDGQFGTVAEFGSTAAWLTRDGTQVFLNLSPAALPITSDVEDIAGVEPGPGGAVMVRTSNGPIIWTADSRLVAPQQELLRTDQMVATADALWVETGGQVTQVDLTDMTSPTYPTRPHPQWTTVVTADPRANRVVVTDDQDCHAVLDGTTGEVVWRTCDWTLQALSADGRLAYARSVTTGAQDIVDITTGTLTLRIDPGGNPVGPRLVFDTAGRLNLRVGNDDVQYATMVVEATGDCWMSSGPYLRAVDFVLPNRR